MRPHFRARAATPLPGALATLLAAVLALAGAALGASVPASAEPSFPGTAVQAEHRQVLDFWTPERMAQARSRDYLRDPETERFELAPRPDGSAPRPDPAARGNVIGATWTGGGLVERTTGRLFVLLGGELDSCSGSVVRESSEQTSLVLTAAHCVYDSATGTFATFWMFVPDYAAHPATQGLTEDYCRTTPYGCWTPQGLTVSRAFADQPVFNDVAAMNDVAFATIGPSERGQLDAVVGAQEISFSAQEQGVETYVFGYPGEKKYTGDSLVYSVGRLRFDPRRDRLTYRIGTHMNEGSSGGPWYVGFDPETGAGVTMSVTSYAATARDPAQHPTGQAALYGPVFTESTAALHDAAVDSVGNKIVP